MQIVQMYEQNKSIILNHFLSLDNTSLYTRFCTYMSRDKIKQYVESMDFSKVVCFGALSNDLQLIGLGELFITQMSPYKKAEVGMSVLGEYRGKGVGSLLFQNIITHCKLFNIKGIQVNCLRYNKPMINLCKKNNMHISFEQNEVYACFNM